jgi:hypothetical protein
VKVASRAAFGDADGDEVAVEFGVGEDNRRSDAGFEGFDFHGIWDQISRMLTSPVTLTGHCRCARRR